MFIVYDDMTVSLNRGDVGVIPVPQSKDGDYGYSISAGDVLRIRVFPKKKCEEVALVKDFLVETATSVIELELDGTDTKIGDIINKPTTYWYEIELNPDTYPQTIVGYNEDGPKVFMLYPEGDDSGELPSINTGKPVTVSDEAVKSIINNEIFKEILKNAIIAIDQKYDSESKNAQSGIAVAEAVKELRDTVANWMTHMENDIVVPGDKEVKDYVDDALIVDDFDVGLKFEDYNPEKCFVITNDGGTSFDGVMVSEIVVTNRNKMPVSKGTRIIPGDSCVIQGFAAFDENNNFLSYNSRALDGSDIYGDSDIFSYETFDQLTVDWDGYIMISIRFADTSINSLTDEQLNELVSGVKFFKTLNLKEYIDEILKNFQGGSGIVDDKMSDTSSNPVQNKIAKQYVDTAVANAQKYIDSKESSIYQNLNKTLPQTFVLKENGKGLSSNDFTDEYKEKLDNVTTGADGVSVTHSWNGTVLTITSASGTSSANLKGEKGADGKTPVKGTDYFTEADKTEMVERVVESIDGIPDYWLSALDSGANSIREAMELAGRNKSSFLFYSDAHWDNGSQLSPKLLKYLYKNTAMTKTFFGGDIVNSESTDRSAMEYLYEWREMLKGLPNHHSVVGNHDDGNTTENLFSENYIYAYLLAPEETPNMVLGEGMYYYIDEPCEKTRYLFLDTAYKGVDTTQENFISNALNTIQDGWHIVVISHIWYQPDYDWYKREDKTTDLNIWIDGLDANASKVITLLDAYNSNKNSKGKVEFCIGGHVHRDYVNKTTGGIPIILVETDSYNIRSEFSIEAGKPTESSVNGIISDYDNKVITVVRVGRGSGFTINLESGETHTHSYTFEITTAATCTTAGVRTYTCSCGDTYTEAIPVISHTYVDGVCSVCGAEDGNDIPNYTNVLPTATDIDGSIFNNGKGYMKNRRLSGKSGELKTDTTDADTTGFIPCKAGDSTTLTKGDTIYMKNVVAPYTDSSNYYDFVCFYDESQTFLTGYYINQCKEYTYDSDDNITSFVMPTSTKTDGTAYIRMSLQDINDNSIITVNQEI